MPAFMLIFRRFAAIISIFSSRHLRRQRQICAARAGVVEAMARDARICAMLRDSPRYIRIAR
jgi:hypothetical protein